MQARVIATAYGRPALERLRTVVTAAKSEDPMAPVTVLVPNNIAGIATRRYLAAGLEDRGPGVAGLFVTTLPRLAEQLATTALHPRRPGTSAITAAAWRRALAEDAGCFDVVKSHPATVRALTSAHRELRDLTDSGRELIRDATRLTPDLLRLHESVVTRLSAGWYDATDVLKKAATLAVEHPERLAEYGATILFLPQALTQAEAAFAAALASSGLTVIAGMTGVARADEEVRRTLRRLDLSEPTDTPKPPLASRVLHASDSDDEVRCIVREVTRTLAGGTPAHRVAVLYGAAQPYARLLHEHLAAAGLTVNGPATRAVHERALAHGFVSILELAELGLPRAATFAALSEAPARDLADGTVKVARWERVSRLAGITGGDDWGAKLDGYIDNQRRVIAEQEASPDPWLGVAERAQREIDSAAELAGFIDRLRERLHAGSSAHSWSALSAWSITLFHDLYGDPATLKRLPVEEQYAAAVVESTLHSLSSLDAFEPTADISGLIEVVSLELESALPRVGRFGEGVFVGPISAAVGLDLDTVYLVGLAEDGYPGRLHEDALLNETVRAAAAGELEQPRDQLNTKHRHLLAAFSSAPEVVTSFPRGDLRRSTERLPSRFLLHTLRDITGNAELAATEWNNSAKHHSPTADRLLSSQSFADTLRTTDYPASEQEWRVRAACAAIAVEDPVITSARVLLDARDADDFTRFDGNLGQVEGLPDYAHSDRAISPTSLETFADCPHQYFVKKLLRVEPLEHPEEVITISAMEIGNLIHESMDLLISECKEAGTLPSYGAPWTLAHRTRLREIATVKADEFAAKGVTGHPRLWAPELLRILVELDRMLDDDDTWRAQRDAAVVHSELAFGLCGNPPVVIDLAEGAVRMLGSADKVDRTRDGVLLVTDIKSGSDKKYEGLKTDPIAKGTRLQLPVYAYAAQQILGGDQVEAQYWFVRGRAAFKRIPVKLDDDVQKTYAEAVSTLVTSIKHGLFVARPTEKADYKFVTCEYCTPGGLGHEEARKRYERKRAAPTLAPLIDLVDPQPSLADGGVQ